MNTNTGFRAICYKQKLYYGFLVFNFKTAALFINGFTKTLSLRTGRGGGEEKKGGEGVMEGKKWGNEMEELREEKGRERRDINGVDKVQKSFRTKFCSMQNVL